MNIAEKMEMESRLMGRIADWMEKHGEVLYAGGKVIKNADLPAKRGERRDRHDDV